jgi:hypothetical protein
LGALNVVILRDMTIATSVSPPAPPAPPISAAPDQPRQFFTLQSIGSLAGASTGLYMVVGTISKATDWKFPAWFPLLVAVVLVICIDLAGTNLWQGAKPREIPARILVLALNSCLVYSSAVGGALALTSAQPEAPPIAATSSTTVPPAAAPATPPSTTPTTATPSTTPTTPPTKAPTLMPETGPSAGEPPAFHRLPRAERRPGFSRLIDALQE